MNKPLCSTWILCRFDLVLTLGLCDRFLAQFKHQVVTDFLVLSLGLTIAFTLAADTSCCACLLPSAHPVNSSLYTK